MVHLYLANKMSWKISDMFFCKVRMYIMVWGSYFWNYVAFKMTLSPHRMKMFDLTSETDFACMICCPQIKYKDVSNHEGGENAGPFWTKTKHCHYCWNFAFLYPVLLFLSLVPNNNQGLQKETLSQIEYIQ